jgi:phosphomannomutase
MPLISDADQRLSEILEPIDTRVRSGEINSEVEDIEGTVTRIEAFYSEHGADIDHLDGLTVGFDDWWFNLRASNTQPLLRLNVEAETDDLLREKTSEVLELIRR